MEKSVKRAKISEDTEVEKAKNQTQTADEPKRKLPKDEATVQGTYKVSN